MASMSFPAHPEPADEAAGSSRAGSVEKALSVLECVLQAGGRIPLAGVAAATGIDTATVLRLLRVLVERGYLIRDPASKAYLPGPKGAFPLPVYHPLNVVRRDAQYAMRDLRDDTGLTVALFAFIVRERLLLDIVAGANPISPYYDAHQRNPLHASATGLLLLSGLGEAERDEVLGPAPYAALTPHTITDRAALSRTIAEVLERGYATVQDESIIGLSALAAPLRGEGGRMVGSLVCIGSSGRLTDAEMPKVGARLMSAAAILSNAMPSLRQL